jgi:uncharacterized protein YicC (UPF0701 family)
MSDQHKQALAEGRSESRLVRAYLDALEAHKPKRGRKRTAESVQRRLDAIEAELDEADALSRLTLVQERMDLTNELASLQAGVDLAMFEEGFVEVAASFSERRGISYAAWREIGITPAVLRKAGISR